jgi:3'-5' exoribonuclease
MDTKGPFLIKDLKAIKPGSQIWGKYLLLEKNHKKTKDGKDMYNIKLGDTTGSIDAVIWENCPVAGNLEPGAVIGLLGDMSNFNGKVQITSKRIKVLDEEPGAYLKGPEVSLDELQQRLEELLACIKDQYLSRLLRRLFSPRVRELFSNTPAARSIHHNYKGGLLEHTLSVADLCRRTAVMYPRLNMDLLIAGALLHDIGKIREYELKVVPRYTPEGRLIGHIVLGSEMVSQEIRQMREEGLDFPAELEWMLKNMLLSHHGSLEFGSPVLPLFPEAYLLHAMDDLDARMFVYFNKIDEVEGENEFFSNYDSFFGQHFFKYRY